MFRFLSGRKARNPAPADRAGQLKNSKSGTNKNLIQCRVILLDGTDLSVELSVSFKLVIVCCVCVYLKLKWVGGFLYT